MPMYVVMTSSAAMPQSCRGSYRRVAVVQMIAAAPDLLDACREAYALMLAQADDPTAKSGSTLHVLDAALTKATEVPK